METNNQSEFQPIAQRMVNAENAFCAIVKEIAKCSDEDARKVLRVYTAAKLVKRDAVNGVISVKHGSYWDLETLAMAINS